MNKLKKFVKDNRKVLITGAVVGGLISLYGARKFEAGRRYGCQQAADFVQESVALYELIHKQSLDKELGSIMKFLIKK